MVGTKSVLINPYAAPVEWDENDPLQDALKVELPGCSLFYAEDLYLPERYTGSDRAELTHNLAIRFGASGDIKAVLTGSSDDQSDYLVGLFGTSITLAIIYFAWAILIVCWKGLGYRRVGFLSGKFIRPNKPVEDFDLKLNESNQQFDGDEAFDASDDDDKDSDSDNDDDSREEKKVENFAMEPEASYEQPAPQSGALEEWETKCERQNVRLFRTRVAVVISAVAIIAWSVVFCVYGVNYVQQSLESVEDGLRHVQKLCLGANNVIDNYLERQQALINETRLDLNDINGICAIQPLCRVADPPTDCDFSNLPSEMQDPFKDFFEAIFQETAFVLEDIAGFKEDLNDLYDEVDKILNSENNVEWAYWVAFSFIVCLMCLCYVIIAAVYLAHLGRDPAVFRFFREHVLDPLFIFLVFLAFLFALVFLVGAVASSDWCQDGPDDKVSLLLEMYQDKVDSIIYRFAQYYVNSCNSDIAPVKLVTQNTFILELLEKTTDFLFELQSFDENVWQQQCGNDSSILRGTMTLMIGQLCVLGQTLEDVNRYFWCRNWSPVYELLMHEAICDDLTLGIYWMSVSLMWIVFFSFLLFSLRAATKDVVAEEDFLASVDRCRRLLLCGCLWPKKDPEAYNQMDDSDEDRQSIVGNDQSGAFPKESEDASSDGTNEEADNDLVTGSLAIVDPPRRNSWGTSEVAEFNTAVLRNESDGEYM